MDLLGDIGQEDQLVSARAEIDVLQKRVRELTARVKTLSIENESLKAECEIYRQEAALPNFSNMALGKETDVAANEQHQTMVNDPFVRSGNGIYPQHNQITLTNLHEHSNHLTCALSPDDSILASSGANATVRLVPWGLVSDNNNNNATQDAALAAGAIISCQAPCVTMAFSPVLRGVLAAGCMDGSVVLIRYELTCSMGTTSRRLETKTLAVEKKHGKYVRTVAWSTTAPILATSSADGCIYLYRVKLDGFDMTELSAEFIESLHLQGPIESMCFSENNQLICFQRGTPYLFYFDLNKNMTQTKINLNTTAPANAVAPGGGCDSHVSFTVMDLKPFQDKYLAAATDTSRNMILDLSTGRQIRNLYGHTNDSYSHPKVAWSSSCSSNGGGGQYLMGNTQNEGVVCVWDIASSQIVNRLQPGGTTTGAPIRDMFSSITTDIMVTTSFDKTTRLWFAPTESSNDVPSSMSM